MNDTNTYYHNWPRVKVKFVNFLAAHLLREKRRDCIEWLVTNNVEHYDDLSNNSYFYFTRYIKDPNQMLLFKLRFSDLCCDHYSDDLGVYKVMDVNK